MYGFSIELFGNPFYVQFVFGLTLLLLTYFLGLRAFKNSLIAFWGSFFLLIDPVFSEMMNGALLDLGQAAFSLGYTILLFFYPGSFVWQGVILGLFAASKFWTGAIFFLTAAYLYKFLIRKEGLDWKKILGSFLIAFGIFSFTYLTTFIENGGNFNLFFWQAKTLKFMRDHNSAKWVGGSIFLFLTGFFAPWWRSGVEKSAVWSLLWPISFLNSVALVFRTKVNDIKFYVYCLPVLYLLYTGNQVPFTRYFIIILPYFYLGLAFTIFTFLHKKFPSIKFK